MGAEDIKAHQFKKGQSGNKKGRPKLPDLKEALEEVLGKEGVQEILEAMRKKALKGSEKAADILLDRCFGKAKQSIDLKADVKGDVIINRHVKDGDKP